MQIVVVGMHRSGTSALTRVLGLMGCWLGEPGDFNPTEPDNPKGYWERQDVWALNEAMLASQGATWCRVADFDVDRWDPATRAGFEQRAGEIVAGLDAHGTWAIKDPRMCLLLPVWQAALTRPVYLLMVRRPLQVARSLQTRDGFPLAVGAALWEKHLLAAMHHTAGQRRLIVYHEDLVGDPATAASDLLAGLESVGTSGLHRPEDEALSAFVDPALFRAHGTGREEASLLNSVQHDLWRSLADGSAMRRNDWPEISTGCDDLLRCWGEQLESFERLEERAGRLDEAERDRTDLQRRVTALEAQDEELRRHASALEAQVEDLQRHLDSAGDQNRELSDELREALDVIERLKQRARAAEDRATAVEDLRALRRALLEELKHSANLFDQQQALMELVLSSRRYRFAETAGETARRLTLRQAQPAAAEHAARIRDEYRKWRRALIDRHGVDLPERQT